jgi:hypothetical protein
MTSHDLALVARCLATTLGALLGLRGSFMGVIRIPKRVSKQPAGQRDVSTGYPHLRIGCQDVCKARLHVPPFEHVEGALQAHRVVLFVLQLTISRCRKGH